MWVNKIDFLHECMFSRAMIGCTEIRCPQQVFACKERDTLHTHTQTGAFKAYSSWQGLTLLSPDSSRARLSLQFVSWRRGSPNDVWLACSPRPRPGSTSTSLNKWLCCQRLRSRTPSARLTRGLVLGFDTLGVVVGGIAPCQSPPSGVEMRRLAVGSLPDQEARGKKKWRDDNKAVVLQLCQCQTRHEYTYCQVPFMPFSRHLSEINQCTIQE